MNDNKPWFYIMILLVFSTGISAGILLDKAFLSPRPTMPIYSGYDASFSKGHGPGQPGMHGGKPGPGGPQNMEKNMKNQFLKMLTEELSLTPDQQKKLSTSFDEIEPEVLAMRKDMDKKMTAIHDKMNDRINKVLNDDQKKQFKEMDARMARMKPGRDHGGPPPEFRDGQHFGPGSDNPESDPNAENPHAPGMNND